MNYDYSFRSWKWKEVDYCLEPLKGVAALPTLWFQSSETYLGLLTFMTRRQFFPVELFSRVQLFVTPWNEASQASLSFTISQSLLKLMFSESVMPSNHLVLCHPLLPLPSIFPSSVSFLMSWIFTSGSQNLGASASAPVLPVNIQKWFPLGLTGLISLQPKGLSSLLQHHSSKASILQCSAFFMVQLSHPYMTTAKIIALTIQTFVSKVISLLFYTLSRFVIAIL